jgi:hypothetical protein
VPGDVVASVSDVGLTVIVGPDVAIAPIKSWSPVNPGVVLVWTKLKGLPLPGEPPWGVTNLLDSDDPSGCETDCANLNIDALRKFP